MISGPVWDYLGTSGRIRLRWKHFAQILRGARAKALKIQQKLAMAPNSVKTARTAVKANILEGRVLRAEAKTHKSA